MKTKSFIALLLTSIGYACSPEASSPSGQLWTADVRSAIKTESSFSMKEDVASIEYIPLETTDECLISNVTSLIANEDYIFLKNGKTSEIFQFNRQGKYLRKIGKLGEGPGEYAPYAIHSLSLDNEKNEIYLNRGNQPAMIYSFEGEYLRTETPATESVGQRFLLKDGSWGLSGVHFMPKKVSPWLLALKDSSGNLIESKAVFPPSVPEQSAYMKDIQMNPFGASVVAFTPCCDTLFRATPSGIEPACIYNRQNGKDYYTLIADINDLQANHAENYSTIQLFSFFETSRYFYFRAIKRSNPDEIYIQRMDKQNGEFLSQRIQQDFVDVSVGFSDGNVLGLPNDMDGGVPFCPNYVFKDQVCMQVVNATTLKKLEEKGHLKHMPQELAIDELDNPVVIIYHFK